MHKPSLIHLLLACSVLGSGLAQAQATTTVAARPVQETTVRNTLLDRRVSVDIRQKPLEQAIDRIASRAGVMIQYGTQILRPYTDPVTLLAQNEQLGAVLDRLLMGTALHVVADGDSRLALVRGTQRPVVQESGIVQGQVTDAKTGKPVAGARITVESMSQSVTTDSEGKFRISVSAGEQQIVVRSVGYLRQVKTVSVQAGETVAVDFVLEASANVLNEVIVTGTVVATERKAIPNPITVITAEEIERRGITRIDQFFRGEVPGVISLDRGIQGYALTNSALSEVFGELDRSDIYARGASNLTRTTSGPGELNPLKTFVDGVELLDPAYLGTIDPRTIERIEIITGPQAATIYGSGAMGGVMQIFTKKGSGHQHAEVVTSLRYGMLQNNLASGLTPTHNHSASLNGGVGTTLSYSVNTSYTYQGQWIPGLFSNKYGGSVGINVTNGPFQIDGTFSLTTGRNGTSTLTFMRNQRLIQDGTMTTRGDFLAMSFTRRIAESEAQTLGLNVSFAQSDRWQHRMTVGRSQNKFRNVPQSPVLVNPADSLYKIGESAGQRTTLSYNTTFLAPQTGVFSTVLTIGGSGSLADQSSALGCIALPDATQWIGCTTTTSVRFSQPRNEKTMGGFGTLRLGVLDQLYFTLGIRAERNPSYGDQHKIDWTPNHGVTYTHQLGEATVKLLASYGRATRAPSADMRRQVISTNFYLDSAYVSQFANSKLTPEYSRGPQGGVELYYGNTGSLTLNYYRQTISDLIQIVAVDTVWYHHPSYTECCQPILQNQYQNVASIRNKGWESTGSLRAGAISLKGTYSWTDSRVIHSIDLPTVYYPGRVFSALPSHTANISATYSSGNASVMWITNYIGASSESGYQSLEHLLYLNDRHRMYSPSRKSQGGMRHKPGYTKSDLSGQYRISPAVTATFQVLNIADDYMSDVETIHPTLGRQTQFGLTMRF